jgi:adenylyltransferase/sulfurtransferase
MAAAVLLRWGKMTEEQRDRYSRQIRFHSVGEAGQERLLRARVTVVGCGALGSFHAEALARVGVGRLRLVDRDYVELSNLQRQWLFDENDARDGLPKAAAAARKLAAINSGVAAEPIIADLTPRNAEELLSDSDLILDGTDNFETRYLINDYAVREGIPWIYGAAVASYGLVMPVLPGRGPCLRCVYPSPPAGVQPTCETSGVLGALTSLIASLQCGAAMRLLTGNVGADDFRLTTADVWTGQIRQIGLPARDPECPACALRQFEYLSGSHRAPVSLCGRNAVQIHERSRPIDLQGLAAQLAPFASVKANEFALRAALPPYEMTVFPDGRAIIKGTTDIGIARSLYARYVGV